MHLSVPRGALIAGLVLGVILGLIYGWMVDPVPVNDTHPGLLRSDNRHDWVILTALSYVADEDLEQARARLNQLDEDEVTQVLGLLIEAYAAAGRPPDVLRPLTTLGKAYDVDTPAMRLYSRDAQAADLPAWSAPTLTPWPTPTLIPWSLDTAQRTPAPVTTYPSSTAVTPGPPSSLLSQLSLDDQEQLCDSERDPQIQVVVVDEDGQGVPGVVIWLVWSDGTDRAVTGLKPAQGPGYVDFNAAPGVNYTVTVDELTMPLVTGLHLEGCPVEPGEAFHLGSWRIVLAPGRR